MTNNDKLKEDSTELLNRLIEFRRDYRLGSNDQSAPINGMERELRLILMAVRTDEENKAQSERDCLG